MSHDVFISYSHKDKLIADAVCANLKLPGLYNGFKRGKNRIWGNLLLIAMLVVGLLTNCSYKSEPVPANPSTPTDSPTITATIRSTPTPSQTSTPRPTATKTPQPAWVAEFAQPILDAIASRSPSFQDDFHNKSGGWQALDWCGKRMEYVQGEMVVTDCRLSNPHINYSDFVAEFDARLVPGAGRDYEWIFHFRETEGPNYEIRINYLGDVHLYFYQGNNYEFPAAANPGDQSDHVMVIAKGDRTAYFINSEPLFYVDISTIRYGNLRFLADDTILAIDNFKVWNIYDLP